MRKQQHRVKLTSGRIEAFTCPAGKSQAFLWDTEAPALALRVTPTGRKTYVFESRLNRATIRINIGTAAIASTVGAKTLGSPIIVGLSGFNTAYILQGALLVGLLAVVTDMAFERVARRVAWYA